MVETKSRTTAGIHYAIYAFATYCLLSFVFVPLAAPFALRYTLEMFLFAGGGSGLLTAIVVAVFWPWIKRWAVGSRAFAVAGSVFLLFIVASSTILLITDGRLYSIPFAVILGLPLAVTTFVACLLAGKLSASVFAFRVALGISAAAFIVGAIAILT